MHLKKFPYFKRLNMYSAIQNKGEFAYFITALMKNKFDNDCKTVSESDQIRPTMDYKGVSVAMKLVGLVARYARSKVHFMLIALF